MHDAQKLRNAVWTVKEGREDAFAEAWIALGDRLRQDFAERRATLLHDRD